MKTIYLLALSLTGPSIAQAELVKLTILKREPFAEGKSFGEIGSYEKIIGVASFAVDPKHPRNQCIVDLDKAERNAKGMVEFEADVYLLSPKDLSKGNGALLYDVNNRGNKLSIGMFNGGGGGNEPGEGNGFLFRRGYTLVWSGWDGEILPGNGRLLLKPPVAKGIRGLVRFEMVADAPAETQPLSRREGHGSHRPTARAEKEGVLTWRARETDERVVIPNGQWSLQRLEIPKVEQGVGGTLGQVRLKVEGGFRVGYIYELICEAEDPIVQGTGFASVRDLLSFLRYDASKDNPLLVSDKPFIQRVHGFGVSQSGRFLRHFLYQGFNADEKDRKVFDGLMPHVAGGGLGFFNHRFAQPTRHNGQHEEHLFPGDMFPFTYGELTDPYFQRTDGILKKLAAEDAKLLPRVMHTQSAAEYWHRSGSLVHTDPLGKKDAEIPDNVRIYTFGGTQHGPASDPPGRGLADNLNNPGDYRPQLRALLDALDAWASGRTEPPPSRYPRIADGTLVGWKQKQTGFPSLPGIRYPEVIQQPRTLDYGPDFTSKGILTLHPPKKLGDYVVLVPRNDQDGNDLGCLLPAEVAVPLATYTGWNLRRRDSGAEGMLASLMGSYLPFPRTPEERVKIGDPRKSIAERYKDFSDYESRFREYCERLKKERLLLEEDADRSMAGRQKLRW